MISFPDLFLSSRPCWPFIVAGDASHQGPALGQAVDVVLAVLAGDFWVGLKMETGGFKK